MANYVIITPAHNEAELIEKTIRSMAEQTAKPLRWVIVNDASNDQTAAIVEAWAKRLDFLQLINLQRDPGRTFARKALAFERGFAEVSKLDFDFIGNLDADISFGASYFEKILEEFSRDPELGVGGGIVYTQFTDKFATYDHTPDSVGGKVQLFRRKCFQDIGGYLPLRYGGIDAAAEIMARMKGWKVRKSFENKAYEHRPTGFADGSLVRTGLRDGRKFYSLGYDPLFYLVRCLYRLTDYPYILGSGVALLGFLSSLVLRQPIVLPSDVVDYLRKEQRMKLKRRFCFWQNN